MPNATIPFHSATVPLMDELFRFYWWHLWYLFAYLYAYYTGCEVHVWLSLQIDSKRIGKRKQEIITRGLRLFGEE